MKNPLLLLSSALLITSTSLTFAAGNTDLSVSGTITPSACKPSISADGVVDYGKMSAKQLNQNQHTLLASQTLDFRVLCDGPTVFTMTTVDNQAGTSPNHDSWHGLGMTPEGENLGGSGFRLSNPVADGVPALIITSLDGGATWQPSAQLSHLILTAVTTGSALAPIAVRDFTAQLELDTHIAPAAGLTVKDEVELIGSATLQVKYL
ncbi:DUF1120 domain-containing protein [Pseudomonas kitaguniensis]|uniref:DUF1120 domain-containing protein n=1 Tax=Pseudomonas kitaguniensis TaxID=2607908 RepID=UPI003D07800A